MTAVANSVEVGGCAPPPGGGDDFDPPDGGDNPKVSAKRIFDLIFLAVALPMLLPLILLTALYIKATSRGPLLIRQERIGFLGRRFALLKFRTMVPGSDTGVNEAHVGRLTTCNGPMPKLDTHRDERLIPLGRHLRAAGLDELPQFVNVLRGEMSLVGPRPCLPTEYDKHLPWQKDRFHTLPGLTGLWQVSGKKRTTFAEMIDLDLQYIRMRSLLLDLTILLKTFMHVTSDALQSAERPQSVDRTNEPQGLRSLLLGDVGLEALETLNDGMRGALTNADPSEVPRTQTLVLAR